MPAYIPGSDDAALLARLDAPHAGIVACFCAAWCDTCRAYLPKFDELSDLYPQLAFVWVDIEDHPDLLGDEDVENFPTLLVELGGRAVFYGTMLPHIGHLQRMIDNLEAGGPAVETALPPDLPALLRRAATQRLRLA